MARRPFRPAAALERRQLKARLQVLDQMARSGELYEPPEDRRRIPYEPGDHDLPPEERRRRRALIARAEAHLAAARRVAFGLPPCLEYLSLPVEDS